MQACLAEVAAPMRTSCECYRGVYPGSVFAELHAEAMAGKAFTILKHE